MPLDSNEVNVNLTEFQTNGHFKIFGQKLSDSNQVQHDYSEAPCISDFGWLFQYIYLTYQCINKTCFNEVWIYNKKSCIWVLLQVLQPRLSNIII